MEKERTKMKKMLMVPLMWVVLPGLTFCTLARADDLPAGPVTPVPIPVGTFGCRAVFTPPVWMNAAKPDGTRVEKMMTVAIPPEPCDWLRRAGAVMISAAKPMVCIPGTEGSLANSVKFQFLINGRYVIVAVQLPDAASWGIFVEPNADGPAEMLKAAEFMLGIQVP
jgi:hypothetical protein